MVIRHTLPTGPQGFERHRVRLGEDTKEAVAAAREWLLREEPFGDISIGDHWRARCLGARLSAEVVPALRAGQPVWRVDDRVLWFQNDQLASAAMDTAVGTCAWPGWVAEMPPGGTATPVQPDELAEFLDGMITWRTLGDATATLIDLGWTTADPDTVSQSSDNVAVVRLLRPAGAALRLTLHDGASQRWDLDLLNSADSAFIAVIEQRVRAVLATRPQDNERGWKIRPARGVVPGRTRLSLTGSSREVARQ